VNFKICALVEQQKPQKLVPHELSFWQYSTRKDIDVNEHEESLESKKYQVVEQCSSYHTGSKCFRNNGLLVLSITFLLPRVIVVTVFWYV
jgi:hypothetical protein